MNVLPSSWRLQAVSNKLAAALAGWLLTALHAASGAQVSQEMEVDQLRALLGNACWVSTGSEDDTPGLVHEGATDIVDEPVMRAGVAIGRRFTLTLGHGDELRLDRLSPRGRLVRVNAEYRRRVEGRLVPSTLAVADGNCRIIGGRRLEYDGRSSPQRLVQLGNDLIEILHTEPLDAPVPEAHGESVERDGVIVAMVDAGVNYTLDDIAGRLARDAEARLIGYDFWDMDERPFDTSPSQSPYAPRRHGTRTASLLLAEAPYARLAPYRYPRPDMSRMKALVEHAAANGVRIVNLSLGGGEKAEWEAFEAAAAGEPEILFVASAGNDGRDIDRSPVYPAALDFANLLTVTSADEDGRLASGSNWGAGSVDLMVPAEHQPVTGFDGHARLASGSSYAAARVSALAACLSQRNPALSGAQLRAAIVAMAVEAPEDDRGRTAFGLLPDPVRRQRGACAPEPGQPTIASRVNVAPTSGRATGPATHGLELTLVRLQDSGWSEAVVQASGRRAAAIFSQCGIRLSGIDVLTVSTERRMRYFENRWSTALVRDLDLPRPTAFFVRGTLQSEPYEAEAVGNANGRQRPRLIGTAWLTSALQHPGVGLAHELVHLFTDSGAHDSDPSNLMYPRTSEEGTRLREGQCMQIRATGTRLGLLSEL